VLGGGTGLPGTCHADSWRSSWEAGQNGQAVGSMWSLLVLKSKRITNQSRVNVIAGEISMFIGYLVLTPVLVEIKSIGTLVTVLII
jgi:hypothetical protein